MLGTRERGGPRSAANPKFPVRHVLQASRRPRSSDPRCRHRGVDHVIHAETVPAAVVVASGLMNSSSTGISIEAADLDQHRVTQEMWVGIPAGIEMTNTQSTSYDPATQRLLNTHHMATVDGKVISTGSNMMNLGSRRKTVVSAGSGFDMGKPYHGNAVLVAMTADSLTWEYTEMSQGKTTVYENVVTFTGPNTQRNAVREGRESPDQRLTRANPAKELLPAAGWSGTGTRRPDGYRQAVSWIGDGHVLKFVGKSKQAGGDWRNDNVFLWFWDPAFDHISTLFLDQNGAVIHGKIDSISRNGDSVTIVSSHEGSLQRDDHEHADDAGHRWDTLTGTFQGMALDGIRHKLNGADAGSAAA